MFMSKTLSQMLKNPDLLVSAALVGDSWVEKASNGKSFDVLNPSTGEVITSLPDLGVEEARKAIDAAEIAQKDWAQKTGKERSAVLRKFNDLMVANADDLGAILTAEMGKPLAEAKGEIMYGASFIEWFAEEAKRVYG
ncbi:MAG: aldehyde dehydrogenase family protein, partial [Hoeflea sp.]